MSVMSTSRDRNSAVTTANPMAISTANLKALVGDFGYAGPDAEIQFSNQFAFDFNARDGIAAGSYDFVGVAVHEAESAAATGHADQHKQEKNRDCSLLHIYIPR